MSSAGGLKAASLFSGIGGFDLGFERVGTLLSNGAGTQRPGGNKNEASYIVSDAQQMPRRLTPRECERLQGFPDDWTGGQSDTRRYVQLGNAVTVNVAEWIGRRLMAVAR
jgi:DNA (cytosine-5)-methyltransferase 1